MMDGGIQALFALSRTRVNVGEVGAVKPGEDNLEPNLACFSKTKSIFVQRSAT